MTFLLLIDGPKGSGKTTLCELLKKRLENTEFFSLDTERRMLVERTDSRDEDNRRAFGLLVEKIDTTFAKNENAVIDSGLSEERLKILEQIAKNHNVKIHKFALIGPKEILRSRVIERDHAQGKIFDEERFDYTHNAQQSKSFAGFDVIDSSKVSPEEIADRVIGKTSADIKK